MTNEHTFDTTRSLQELEGRDWGEPGYPSSLVMECHRLRRVPLKDFTDEDLARLIQQDISLLYLVPLALSALRARPCSNGELGDAQLLRSVLDLPADFWRSNPELANEMVEIIRDLPARIATLEDFECIGVSSALEKGSPVFFQRSGLAP